MKRILPHTKGGTQIEGYLGYVDLRERKKEANRKNHVMRSFIACTPHLLLPG
jgi:hypothetical protein